MYSCCSGICFLKPASICRWLASQAITTVTSANIASTTGRNPKMIFSLALFRLIAFSKELLRVVGVRALVADDHEIAASIGQDAGQRRRLAGGVVEGGNREGLVRGGPAQHGAVRAGEHDATAFEQRTTHQADARLRVDL